MIIGIVGKANVGKSTFFKALTAADILIANYPFATINPNKGFAHVKIDCVDKFFKVQCNPRMGFCKNGKRFVPVEVLDVAGLVPGAHEGKGMGNKFLDDLRPAHALIHVVDFSGSTNEKGETVDAGSYNPAEDIKFLEIELDMWYLSIMKKGWDKFARQVQQEQQSIAKALGKQLSGLNVNEAMVEDAIKKLELPFENPKEWSEKDLMNLATELRKKTKPLVIAANKIDMPSAQKNLERLQKEFPNHIIIPCSAESELALCEAAKHGLIDYTSGDIDFLAKKGLNPAQEKALNFIRENVLKKLNGTGVQKLVNAAVFDLLHYKAIFPGGVNNLVDKNGNVLPDCFLLEPKATAIDFAYKLHTDIGDHFVKAIDVKRKMPVAKDHILNHCDVVEIKTSN